MTPAPKAALTTEHNGPGLLERLRTARPEATHPTRRYGEFTAMELGILAQWVANRGSYGEWEFITPQTFEKLLPEPLQVADRGHTADEGIGIHWVHHLKPGAAAGPRRPEDLLYGPRTLGHGSFSGCIFVIDPEQQLVIAQVRRQVGPRHAEWSARFFQAIAAAIAP